jgi:hypothetical protein
MNNLSLKSGKWTYNVTYRKTSGLPKLAPFERLKKVVPKIRTTNRIYFDKRDEVIKEINYPEELWFSEVVENDPVEQYIYHIMELYPNWVKIDIKNNE